MNKDWVANARKLLTQTLKPIPCELNEIDWKEQLSPDTSRLAEHLSAFSNYPGGGYIIFGIEDSTGKLIGVSQAQAETIVRKLGNICRMNLEPVISIDHSLQIFEGIALLFIHVKENDIKPVFIKNLGLDKSFIRSGGTTQQATRPEIGALMLNSRTPKFEELHASKLMKAQEVFSALEYKTIFKLLDLPISERTDEIIKFMIEQKMVKQVYEDGFYITNFGALSCAHQIKTFDDLSRKAVRLIKYSGTDKQKTDKEMIGTRGYGVGFESLIHYINLFLPSSEVIGQALRKTVPVYPEIAIRELCANALIHQDFTIRGTSPMFEIFSDRIEISNPGKLLPSKTIDRLIRTSNESRNEILANAFRNYKICEERGSGLEKAVKAIELYGLPPLKFEELENSFKVTIYSPKSLAELTPDERIEACYQHSVIKHYSNSALSNSSLRERFKVSERFTPQVSLVIKEATERGRIKLKNPDALSKKFAEYIPHWA